MFSNRYIFIYSSVMVIIVAALLSTTSLLLQPRQQKNKTIAKIQGMLAAMNVEATFNDAEELYATYVKTELAIDQDGEVVGIYRNGTLEKGTVRPFDIDLKKELYNKKMGRPFLIPLFIAENHSNTMYVVPLRGVGLWGPLYGNITFGPGFDVVVGAQFSHDKETPGLGAEISTNEFASQFIGKKILDDNGRFTSIKVVKGGAATLPADQQVHGVDAISGGTITSNGVNTMLADCLENYMSYIQKNITR
ncbi:MAG: NADH:ubiquinone reductase (Na(+)-transporting) subunit C [Bacteroidetes bacterium]|nr:MAG: NADH:ubiquinone reductase (Na(+)-transporting) subunit C [Bacteroidota bacterium]